MGLPHLTGFEDRLGHRARATPKPRTLVARFRKRGYLEAVGVIRVTLAVLAAVALAATLALLAVAAPAASQQRAATGDYCPDKTARQHDAAVAHKALTKANANVKLRAKALAKAKKTHKGIPAAQKNLRVAKGRAADARAESRDASAALADC